MAIDQIIISSLIIPIAGFFVYWCGVFLHLMSGERTDKTSDYLDGTMFALIYIFAPAIIYLILSKSLDSFTLFLDYFTEHGVFISLVAYVLIIVLLRKVLKVNAVLIFDKAIEKFFSVEEQKSVKSNYTKTHAHLLLFICSFITVFILCSYTMIAIISNEFLVNFIAILFVSFSFVTLIAFLTGLVNKVPRKVTVICKDKFKVTGTILSHDEYLCIVNEEKIIKINNDLGSL